MRAPCVLLCDDELHILRAAQFKFQRAGFEVLTAGDGEEAWAILQQRRPDLVITDCQMPRLSGLGLVARMRQHPPTAGLPVVMLTAKGFELSAEQLQQQYGICRLVPKPFSPRELLALAEAILREAASSPPAPWPAGCEAPAAGGAACGGPQPQGVDG
jgi:two-component system alkaline phosphatase synthesis response regulator PhoP